ncbi:MAG TPA: carbohydrate binding domain-containing protein [Verrucomicrobiae bacterium]|nr:carbohydrate binding domain-containing protein [Verrucomicrobiae bacterium]
MKKFLLFAIATLLCAHSQAAERFADRFVFIFGWGLNRDSDVEEISKVLRTAGEHHFNGAVMSFGLDSLCKQSPDYFRRLDQVKKACEDNRLELIPSVFSVGYGGGALAHDRNLAEGLPVNEAPLVVHGDEATLEDTNSTGLVNGGFEEHQGNNLKGFAFHDQPGEISFVDTDTKHSGQASLRLENFTTNQYGHGRIMQTVKVQPHRCYRATLWVKTENLQPANAFRMLALAGERELAPREFHIPPTTDWRKVTMLFNSLDNEKLSLYAGLWGGKSGKVWLDDWTLDEVGPVNVLHRPGTPVTVRNADGSITYTEGKDYAPLVDASLQPWSDDKPALPLKILSGGRIHDGERLRVSWYHSMIINDSQVGVCMAEPELYEIFDHEAKLLAEKLQPTSVLLNMDEIRMGGTCKACEGRNMGELLGQCITKQASILRKHIPSVEIYIWSDMLDPNHNAHGNYYLVNGDYTGSWEHVPKNLIMTVWGGEPNEKSLRFFADHNFRTLIACYYDADNLDDVKGWLNAARGVRKVRGFMYTPWEKKYALLPDFGELLRKPSATAPAAEGSK